MAAFIKDVFCAFPQYRITSDQLMRLYALPSFGYSEEKIAKIQRIISSMKIESRPTCVDFEQFWEQQKVGLGGGCGHEGRYPGPGNLFAGAPVQFRPSLGDRAVVWERAVKDLSVRAAEGVMSRSNTAPSDIDCVITNTSTGVMLPNLSTWLPQQLNLENIRCKYSLDNTGCGGAISCLDVARSIILAGRARCILVVTVDCASPHLNTVPGVEMEDILPNLLFGDGAGAMVITNRCESGSWVIEEPQCHLLGPETANYIDMKLSDSGYHLNLSKELVPTLYRELSGRWRGILSSLCIIDHSCPGHVVSSDNVLSSSHVVSSDAVQGVEWIVHPGGKAILDTFTLLSPPLSPHNLRHSFQVMRGKGNLVSATLLFVLDRVIHDNQSKDVACLVGPGPGVEIGFVPIKRIK